MQYLDKQKVKQLVKYVLNVKSKLYKRNPVQQVRIRVHMYMYVQCVNLYFYLEISTFGGEIFSRLHHIHVCLFYI